MVIGQEVPLLFIHLFIFKTFSLTKIVNTCLYSFVASLLFFSLQNAVFKGSTQNSSESLSQDGRLLFPGGTFFFLEEVLWTSLFSKMFLA